MVPNYPPHPQKTATAQAVALPTGPPPLEERKGPPDDEIQEVLRERERKKFKLGMAVNLTILAPFLGFSIWYKSSEKNQQAFASLMGNVREVPNDVKGMANIKESYDETLAEVGSHGSAIDDATRALGVVPNEFSQNTDEKNDPTFVSEQAQQQSMN